MPCTLKKRGEAQQCQKDIFRETKQSSPMNELPQKEKGSQPIID